MGFHDGREIEVGEWLKGEGSQWLTSVSCNGDEPRLDLCPTEGWATSCLGLAPAGVRCI